MSDDELARAFGDFVRARRKLANISQRQLGRMSGLSDSYLSQVERGLFRPSAATMKALAQAFGIPTTVMYTQFGLLDDDDVEEQMEDSYAVEHAIEKDPRLGADQKHALIVMYRSLVGATQD